MVGRSLRNEVTTFEFFHSLLDVGLSQTAVVDPLMMNLLSEVRSLREANAEKSGRAGISTPIAIPIGTCLFAVISTVAGLILFAVGNNHDLRCATDPDPRHDRSASYYELDVAQVEILNAVLNESNQTLDESIGAHKQRTSKPTA